MMKYLVLRDFRISHSITVQELARASKVSKQRISEIELVYHGCLPAEDTKEMIMEGLAKIIEARRASLRSLEKHFDEHKDHLFDVKNI